MELDMPNILSISDFRANATTIIKELTDSDTPVVLTHNGREAAVVVSPRKWKQAQDLKAMLQLLQISEKSADAGDVVDFDEALDTMEAMVKAHGK